MLIPNTLVHCMLIPYTFVHCMILPYTLLTYIYLFPMRACMLIPFTLVPSSFLPYTASYYTLFSVLLFSVCVFPVRCSYVPWLVVLYDSSLYLHVNCTLITHKLVPCTHVQCTLIPFQFLRLLTFTPDILCEGNYLRYSIYFIEKPQKTGTGNFIKLRQQFLFPLFLP